MLILMAALAASTQPATDAKPICQNAQPRIAAGSLYRPSGEASAKRLGELPPADHILTVIRREDGCERPVVVRSGIGATPRP